MAYEQIIGKVDWSNEVNELQNQVNNKADLNHIHDEFNILQTQIDGKADADHTHDNLDGLQDTIESAVNDALSEIIANAPEDLNTLKEIADWIDTHEDSASAMNTAIQENKALINNKADKNHTHNEFVKTAQLTKSDGTTNTFYYLIAKSLGASSTSNCDTIFIDGSDYNNRMFEGVIRTRGGNTVYNYGKNDLPLEFYSQTDGTINVYWKVSDAYNRVALSISSSSNMTIYSGNISNTTPTGTKMNFGAYDYKAVANMNIKNFGSPSNTTRYVELSSAENFAGVEVNIAYAGKWYFSIPGSAPLYLGSGGTTYSNYGFSGWAWGTDNKKLYLRFAGYRGVSVSVLGANTNIVSISDWTTTSPTLPSGVSWSTNEYDIKAKIDVIDSKANYKTTSMVGLGFTVNSYVSVRDFWTKLFSTFGSNGVLHFTWSNANAAYVGDTTSNVYLSGGTLIYTVDRNTTSTWGAFSAIYLQGSGNRVYNIKCNILDDNTAGKESWSIQTIANHNDLSNYVNKNAANVMGANSGLDFNTNKATLRIPVFEASDAVPASNGAFFIQKVN